MERPSRGASRLRELPESTLPFLERTLPADGRYVLSTAVCERARDYGDDYYDPATGIVWVRTAGSGSDGRRIGGSWYLPHRRHLTASALRAELQRYGYRIIEQSPSG